MITYTKEQADAVLNATEVFCQTSTDPKAQILLTIEALPGSGITPVVLFFYDGPNPGDSFSMFDGIPAALNTIEVQSFSTFVAAQASELLVSIRGVADTLSVSQFTPAVLDAVKSEIEVSQSCSLPAYDEQILTFGQGIASQQLAHSGSLSTIDVDPFLQYGQYATESAFPHADSPLPVRSFILMHSVFTS